MAEAARTVRIEVMRYHPETDNAPRFQSYEVPFADDTSVLQGLQHIKDRLDGTLTFRWSCRMAVCGSCGVMVDGVPHLSCKTFLRDYADGVRIEPLEHFPIERDLAIDQRDFVAKLEGAKPWLIPAEDRELADGPHRQTPAELERFRQYSQCINCMLCYAACPQYGLNREFTGPAILALIHRYNADSRDGGKRERMELVNAEEGVWGCTLVGYCSEVCPKSVDPAHAVNENKVASALDYFVGFVAPRGMSR